MALEGVMEPGSTPSFEPALRDLHWVRHLARRLVSDPEAAEDLAQETWLVALQSREGARLGLRAWLAGIARLLALRRLRRVEPERRGLLDDHSGSPGAHELVQQADFQRRVLAAVMALDEPYRATILRHYFEGLSSAELARRLGVSPSTVRTRLQRAHAQLRERLDREWGDRAAWGALAWSSSKVLVSLEAGVLAMKTATVIGGIVLVGGLAYWTVTNAGRKERDARPVTGRSVLAEPSAPPQQPEQSLREGF